MIFKDEKEVVEKIKTFATAPLWVVKAREQHALLKALVLGKDFAKQLVERIEKIESNDRAVARAKYSKDIRDMFDRVMQPRHNVFTATGGATINKLKGQQAEKLNTILKYFKGQKSLKQYLSENYFRLEDTDPNGLMFMEYKDNEDIYPTYKSINDIRFYKSNGQLLDFVIFEPKTIKIGKEQKIIWRVVDERKDYTFIQSGESYILDEERTFEHPFKTVPAIILSDIQETGTETRLSPLFPIEELSKDYARDKSIRTIYKFQHGFPRHWRYEAFCRACQGSGKSNDGKTCTGCKGTGIARTNDVTDVSIINLPREGQPIVTPNIEGFVSPDLATWERFNNDMRDAEELIEATMWGTKRVQRGATNETATGRFIDVQPVTTKISRFADTIEFATNMLVHFVEDWINGKPKENYEFTYIAGRRFIIESPDVLEEKYTKAMTSGVNSSILDKMLEEYIYSKYQSNEQLLDAMLKKKNIEPYVHNTVKDVSDIFGQAEAYKKILFIDFWEQADIAKDEKVLREEFNAYVNVNANQLNVVVTN